MPHRRSGSTDSATPGFAEFVALIALMMGMTAFSIDNLLPAFGPIRAHYQLENPNDLQLLITAYMVGFGLMQIVFGTVSDVVGRKKALMVGLAIYAFGCVLAMVAETYPLLLAARVIQGLGAAAARVLSIAIVRDRYEGREMAQVMSFSMMVFLIIPVIAPTFASGVLLVAEWHMIFGAMLILCVILAVWFGVRMPETLHPEYRVAFSLHAIGVGMKRALTHRRTLLYTTAMGLMLGCLMAYVAASQQIFEDGVYHLGKLFPLAFAVIAAVMGVASFINAKLVRSIGMRRLSHFGVCGFTLTGLALVISGYAFDGPPPVILFCVLLSLAQALFAITVPNFNTIAMEPMGAVAGTASSFIGFYTTLMGAVLGLIVGRAFDGTILPLGFGYLILGGCAVLLVLAAENGRLFSAQRDPA
ncbi:MAG: multidrug effflux MFS transporter [Pseudomonadota bacterium]